MSITSGARKAYSAAVRNFSKCREILNTFEFALKPARLGVLIKKLIARLLETGGDESVAAASWAKQRVTPMRDWLSVVDPEVWDETCVIAAEIREQSRVKIEELKAHGVDLGGGGSVELLYFWTRIIKPVCILETGVAAGWSSYSFLLAIQKNHVGELLSSDLPYFRIKDPEKYIGILVPAELRNSHWRLGIQGDDLNLPTLLASAPEIQIVHYDSDKRKIGRKSFLSKIECFLAEDSLVIMDDIQNNFAFKEYVENGKKCFVIIESEDKYVGVALLGAFAKFGRCHF